MNSAAIEVEFDKQGRKHLTNATCVCGIRKRIVALSGTMIVFSRFERRTLKKCIAETEENFEELAEHMIDLAF